jgi:hypothetical protein
VGTRGACLPPTGLLVGDFQFGLAGLLDEIDQGMDGLAHSELPY